MPILWRYLAVRYIKTLLLSIFTFVVILITLRMEEIAHFATLGPDASVILKFALYQIPYILPIAIPVSSLIAALLLTQNLSESHELTAMRSFGLSITNALTPILMIALAVSLLNFWIVSELATTCHLGCTKLKAELRMVNPLLLASHKHLIKIKGLYFDALGASKLGESAEDAIFAYPEKKSGKIALLIAKKLSIEDGYFQGKDVTLIGSIGSKEKNASDSLLVENIGSYSLPLEDFSLLIENKTWSVSLDYLKMPLLLIKKEQEEQIMRELQEAEETSEAKAKERSINRLEMEIVRRISVGMAAFTFTLLGLSFGIRVLRSNSLKDTVYVMMLAAFFLVSYFIAKGSDHKTATALTLYTLPHGLIILFSSMRIHKLERGAL